MKILSIFLILFYCSFVKLENELDNDYYDDGIESDLIDEPGLDFGQPYHPDYEEVQEWAYSHLCRFNGRNPNPNDCNGYYICKDGEIKHVVNCPMGTLYSSKKRRCITATDLKEEDRCKPKQGSPYYNKFDEEVYKLSDDDLKELEKAEKDPLCIESDGFNPNLNALSRRDRCSRYVECKNGRLLPGRRDCPSGLTYDTEYRTCVLPKENTRAECNALDTDSKRLKYFCRRRFLEGKLVSGTTTLFQSVKHRCKWFIICSTKSDHTMGSCPDGKSFHPTKRQCLKHLEVPGCETRHYRGLV